MSTNTPFLSVHAGAHLTRSDDLHRFAAANAGCLADKGVVLVCPDADRNGAGFGWPSAGTSADRLSDAAEAIADALSPSAAKAARALIVSDADLAGTAGDLLGGRFYPAAGLRATALRMALGRRADRVVLTIRPYDDLFRAVWRNFAAHGDIAPFSAFAPAMAAFTGGWIETTEALQDILEPEVLVIRTEAAGPAEMLSTLIPGLRLAHAVEPAAVPQVTASAAATIQRHIRQGAPLAAGQRERLIAFHARLPQDPGAEAGFEALALADLRGRYVADLAILSGMKGVELHGTGAAVPMRRFARAGA